MTAGENLSTQFEPIRRQDLSSGDARRSRAVSATEFHRVASRGAATYAGMSKRSAPIEGTPFHDNFDKVVNRAHRAAQEPWGGVTVDAHTGRSVPKNADKYALTVRPPGMDTISVPAGAGKDDFTHAMHKAKEQYGPILAREGHHLGVFHDADKGTIDIDPVLVVKKKEDAEAIGAYTHNVGGAYHFKSGNGYWPPHVRFGEPTRAAAETGRGALPKPFDPAKGKDRKAPVSTSAHPVARMIDLRKQLGK